MRQSAVGIIIKDGKILGIARKTDHTKFGLIGGGVESGEAAIETLKRECKEEIGIDVISADLIYGRLEPSRQEGEEPSYTYCFYITKYEGEPKEMPNESPIRWLTLRELTDESVGAYWSYNYAATQRLFDIYPYKTDVLRVYRS